MSDTVDPPLVLQYNNMAPEGALVARCHDDTGYAATLESEVRRQFPEFIEENQPFDDGFIHYMTMQALDRLNNPLLFRMTRNARRNMNKGQQQIYSERQPNDSAQDTAPLHQHPYYDEIYNSAQPSSSPRPATNKGRGKGYAQQRDAQWENQWYGWSDRGWNSW